MLKQAGGRNPRFAVSFIGKFGTATVTLCPGECRLLCDETAVLRSVIMDFLYVRLSRDANIAQLLTAVNHPPCSQTADTCTSHNRSKLCIFLAQKESTFGGIF